VVCKLMHFFRTPYIMILVLVLGTISDNNVSATETHQSAVLTEL